MPKRGTDHEWKLIKYSGDLAIYAECKCGHYYNCGRNIRNEDGSWSVNQIPTVFYPYCPCCGARKKRHSKKIEKKPMEELLNRKKYGLAYDISDYFF